MKNEKYQAPINMYISSSYDDAELAQKFLSDYVKGFGITVDKQRNGDELYVTIDGLDEDIDALVSVYTSQYDEFKKDCEAEPSGWVSPVNFEKSKEDESMKSESKKSEKSTTNIETYEGFDELLGYADAEYLLEDVVDVLSKYYTYEDETFDEDQADGDPEFTIKIEGGDERADYYCEKKFYVHLPSKDVAEELASVLGGKLEESCKKSEGVGINDITEDESKQCEGSNTPEDAVLRIFTTLKNKDILAEYIDMDVVKNNLADLVDKFEGRFDFDTDRGSFVATILLDSEDERDDDSVVDKWDRCADLTDAIMELFDIPKGEDSTNENWNAIQWVLYDDGIEEIYDKDESKKSEARPTRQATQIKKLCDMCRNDTQVSDAVFKALTKDYNTSLDPVLAGQYLTATWKSKLEELGGCNGWYNGFKKLYADMGTDFICAVLQDLKLGSSAIGCGSCVGIVQDIYNKFVNTQEEAKKNETNSPEEEAVKKVLMDASADAEFRREAGKDFSAEDFEKSIEANIEKLRDAFLEVLYFDDGSFKCDVNDHEETRDLCSFVASKVGYILGLPDGVRTAIDGYLLWDVVQENIVSDESKKSEKGNKDIYILDLTRIYADGDEEGLDDMQAAQFFYDEDDAIQAAKELADSYKDDDDVVQVIVMAGEQEKPNGDIVGDPFDIYWASSSDKQTTAEYRKKARYAAFDTKMDYYAKGGKSEAKKSEKHDTLENYFYCDPERENSEAHDDLCNTLADKGLDDTESVDNDGNDIPYVECHTFLPDDIEIVVALGVCDDGTTDKASYNIVVGDSIGPGVIREWDKTYTANELTDLWNDLTADLDKLISDHSADESKQTEAKKKYYGYGKDDAIDKEDNDFMWQVAYDWFEDRLPEKLKSKADSAVNKVIDKDSYAYEEIVTMDDYHAYLQKYGPSVIKDIKANYESKQIEGLPPKKLSNRLYRSRADLINKMKTLDAVEITTPAQFNDIHNKQWLHNAGYALDRNGNLVGQTYFGDKDGKWYYATTKTFQGDYLPECKQTEGLWDDWDGKDPKIGIYYTEDELAILKDVFKKYVQEVSGIHYSVPADYTISYDIAEDPLNHFNAVVKAVGKDGKPIYLCNLAGEVLWEPNTPKQFSYYVGQVDSKTGEEKKGKYVIPPRSFFLDDDYYANAKADTRIPLNPSDWDTIDDYFKKFFKQSSKAKKSESLTLKQKELKDMARFGQAEDITTISDEEAKALRKKGIETIGVSRGTYGMNGALLRDNEGKKYVITARSSNLFYFV